MKAILLLIALMSVLFDLKLIAVICFGIIAYSIINSFFKWMHDDKMPEDASKKENNTMAGTPDKPQEQL